MRVVDFDVPEPIQLLNLPAGCQVKGKFYSGAYGDIVVAGGALCDADELLLIMKFDTNGGCEPIGSSLANGVRIVGVACGDSIVYVLGDGGELVVYNVKV